MKLLDKFMPFSKRNDPTDEEWLQHMLYLVHSEAQREDRHHRAAIKADVARRWPGVSVFIQRLKVVTQVTQQPRHNESAGMNPPQEKA